MARMAITIISQSLCLRSNFIITDQNCSGSEPQPQICSPPVCGRHNARDEFVLSTTLRAAKRLQSVRIFSDDVPRFAHVFFGREHVTNPDSHDCSVAQFRLCEISASGGI